MILERNKKQVKMKNIVNGFPFYAILFDSLQPAALLLLLGVDIETQVTGVSWVLKW
jgi:hypothetical protein